jgi:uracil phosphoribosyltransferase
MDPRTYEPIQIQTQLRRNRILREMQFLPPKYADRAEGLLALRAQMFLPSGNGDAFKALEDRELAIMEWAVQHHEFVKKFFDEHGDDQCAPKGVADAYWILRRAHLVDGVVTSPTEFRYASDAVTKWLFSRVRARFDLHPGWDYALFVWRAGLAFADAALACGWEHFAHIGMRRDEKTAQPEVAYYCELPRAEARTRRKVLICDPMLATGGTTIATIQSLRTRGFAEEDICVLAVIGAPEGVDRVLSTYPAVRIFAGALDERLNSRAYIVPGLGDYGDRWFMDLECDRVAWWYGRGVLTGDSATALCERMARG